MASPSSPPHTLLGGLSPAEFLRRHWQKTPLLVRGAYPEFRSPIDPDELAGLTCEEGVEARLVLEKDGSRPWQVRHGPFDEQDFAELPAGHWSLLVQELNKYLPEAALLLDDFAFIPHWRVDDLMISYAPPGGSVGPHTDQYDVFLIQAHGRRRWGIRTLGEGEDECLPGLDLQILRRFEAQRSWVVEPGDLLYLPPGMAHHGVALEPCMTLSVGFRAPSRRELLSAFLDHLAARTDPSLHYRDPSLAPQAHPGAVSPAALARLRGELRAALQADDAQLDQWLAGWLTEPQRGAGPPPRDLPIPPERLLARLREAGELQRSDYSRFAHLDREHDGIDLCVDGHCRRLPGPHAPLGRLLTDRRRHGAGDLLPLLQEPAALALVTELYNAGQLFFPDDDE
jgi:50S ribosomal protein L16 3-hydroxylase